MNKNQRLELARWVVQEARRHGADEVAANFNHSRDVAVEIRETKIDKLTESTRNSVSIELYAGGRYSSHSTCDLRRESLSRFIGETVAMTKYLARDPHRGLPDPMYYREQKKIALNTYDDSYETMSSDERVDFARAIEDATRAASDKVLTCAATFSDNYGEQVKVHSNGFEGTRRGTMFSAYSDVTVKGPGDIRPDDYEGCRTRHRARLLSAEQIGRGAVKRALGKIGQKKLASGRYDAVIENRVARSLIDPLVSAMSGVAIQQRRSLLVDKIGQQIASDKFTMIDDPLLVDGLSSQLFDSEGRATRRRIMIDKGVLKHYYVSCYYARQLGIEPTVDSPTNTVLEYGDRSLDEMIAGMERGILITDFIGGNSNSATGDASAGITGIYIENGKKVHPVGEMNLSGNLAGIFYAIAEVGNDPYPYSSRRCPSVYLKDLQFTGA